MSDTYTTAISTNFGGVSVADASEKNKRSLEFDGEDDNGPQRNLLDSFCSDIWSGIDLSDRNGSDTSRRRRSFDPVDVVRRRRSSRQTTRDGRHYSPKENDRR
uniref:Uncharacterized protein n=1 Tax=Corethron hystrix TaxID=216773 RepID=A0A7S1BRV8_9STRA